MTRVRRRIARDRLQQETPPEVRAYFAWRAAHLRERLTIREDPAALQRAIRVRQWGNARWDQLRAAGLSIPEAQRAMRVIPPADIL